MNLLELAKSIGVEGFLHVDEMHKLVEIAAGRDVLEIGSFKGLSAWGMAITANSILCVDTFQAATDGQRQIGANTTLHRFKRATARYSNVTHFQGTSADAHPALDGSWDMIFVDAGHDYDSVRADIERWWPRVVAGGIMAFHDYGSSDYPGVKQAVDEVFGPGEATVTLRIVCKS